MFYLYLFIYINFIKTCKIKSSFISHILVWFKAENIDR